MTGMDTTTASSSASTAAAPPSSSSEQPPAGAIEAIEEDDEFEEFEPCQWNKNDEDVEDSQQWQVRAFITQAVIIQELAMWRGRVLMVTIVVYWSVGKSL